MTDLVRYDSSYVEERDYAEASLIGRLKRSLEIDSREKGLEDWQHLDRAHSLSLVLTLIAQAVNEDWNAEKKRLWFHTQAMRVGKPRWQPYIMKTPMDEAAGEYLAGSFRADVLDRMIIDGLMASEIGAYLDESPLKRWSVSTLLFTMIGNGVVAFFLLWMSDFASWSKVIAGILLMLPVIVRVATGRLRSKVVETVSAMLDAYATLSGSPSSVQHVSEKVKQASDKGVIWPPALFVMLEDVAARKMSF